MGMINNKYVDRLERVARNIPYSVWGKALDIVVDKVEVERWDSKGYHGVADQIIVTITFGEETRYYNMNSFDCVLGRLACIWKPYRDIIEDIFYDYKNILEQPEEYMNVSMTMKEFDTRLDMFIKVSEGKNRFGYCIKSLGLESNLRKKCYRETYNDSFIEYEIMKEVLEEIVLLVKYASDHPDDNELSSFARHNGINDSESAIHIIRELANYCTDVIMINADDDSVDFLHILSVFLCHNHTIQERYERAERIQQVDFGNCGLREREYCFALGIDQKIKADALYMIDRDSCHWRRLRWDTFEKKIISLYQAARDTLEEKLKEQDENLVLRDLYTRIIDTQEEYQTEMSKSFEDYDMNITEDIDDKPRFVLSMPTFNISACDNSKDEAIQLARQMFDAYRKEDIIRRLLDIEEKKF